MAAAASASAGNADGEPTTPFCTSCNTSAVCSGATSARRSRGIGVSLLLDETGVGAGVAQQILEDLARRVARQRSLAHLPQFGDLVVRELRRAEGAHCLGVDRVPEARHHDRLDALAELGIVD